jgi:hypothetical protein
MQSYFYLIINFLEKNFECEYLKIDFFEFFVRDQKRVGG